MSTNFAKTKTILDEKKAWVPKKGDLVRVHNAPKGRQLGKVREIYKGSGGVPDQYRIGGSGFSLVLTADRFSKEEI